MDLAKDILDIAEKVGQAPGLTIATSIVTSILKTVETSKNNTVRLRTLAHSLTSQLIDISENMKGKWDDAPLTLKRAVDEYDAFLLDMLKGITRLSQYSRVRAFLLAGEYEREITRLEKRVADVRSTITMMIGMNISIAVNQVQTSLESYGKVGREVHAGMQQLGDGVRLLDMELASNQITPDFSLFSREDFQVTKTIERWATYDQQRRHAMTITFHRAERCSNGRAILVKTFEGNDPLRVRRKFTQELEMNKTALNPSLLQIIGWSSATAHIPFHVYHAPDGIVEPFFSWLERTILSNPVETIFGLYDMQHSIKELCEFGRSRNINVAYWNIFPYGVVNIKQRGTRPRFDLIHTGPLLDRQFLPEGFTRRDYTEYSSLKFARAIAGSKPSYESISDVVPAATLASMFAGGAKDWFGDPHGIDALFKESYDTIDSLHLGPILLEAGWLGTSSMFLKTQGGMRLGDVGYLSQDGHFEVVANLHTRLVPRTGGLPGWTYVKSRRFVEAEPNEEYAVVTHAEASYRRYQHVVAPPPYEFERTPHYCVRYTDLDEGRAWKTLKQEAFRIIEDKRLSIAPHELQLVTSITYFFTPLIYRRNDSIGMVAQTEKEEFPPDPATITFYEFEREGSFSVLDSGVPELNAQVLYSFQEQIDGLDPTKIQQHPLTGDILLKQNFFDALHFEYLQLPLGVTRPSGIEETPE